MDLKKTVLKNSDLPRASIMREETTTVDENSFADLKKMVEKKNPRNQDLDFFKIHLDDGVVKVEIL